MHTPLEIDVFSKTDNRSNVNNMMVHLKPMESIYIPFKYQSFINTIQQQHNNHIDNTNDTTNGDHSLYHEAKKITVSE